METEFNNNEVYSYLNLQEDVERFKNEFPDLVEVMSIGSTIEGRELYAIKIGSGKKHVLCSGAHHAREWMTAKLIVDFINHLLTDCSWAWLTLREDWLKEITFWFIPMVNPDGVTLVQYGADHFSNRDELIKWNNGSIDFNSWKANSRGVDLNRQYPADWEDIQEDPGEPKPSHFKGEAPLSEPETQALYQFTNSHEFDCAIAYHSSGEEIFWRYTLPEDIVKKHRPLAESLSEVTRYQLIEPEGIPSGGGFTDWFLIAFKKPAFTIEIAPLVGPRPVPNHLYNGIFKANELVLYMTASYLLK